MKIDRLPRDDKTNGWSAILPPREARPALKGDVAADWIVLGAGYAGLAAARRLAENEPDASVSKSGFTLVSERVHDCSDD